MVRSTFALAALLAAAAVCGLFSYRAFAGKAHRPDAWDRAIVAAKRADTIKAVVPALQLRAQAIALFDEVARSGSAPSRSRARLFAGLLQLRNAGSLPDRRQALALAVWQLQQAVRLDPNNDDAAYDLELLLSRSAQVGRPIGQPRAEKKQRAKGKRGASPVGTGY
jgi:hypothetical protein